MSVGGHRAGQIGRPPETPGRWAIEMKWDGMRTICRITRGRVELYSRNRNKVTPSYPELTAGLAECARASASWTSRTRSARRLDQCADLR
ncbi:ATP-dependent DNA ligase [Nocardia gipuzkoensis]